MRMKICQECFKQPAVPNEDCDDLCESCFEILYTTYSIEEDDKD